MKRISKAIKEKVEKCLKENECAISVEWGIDSCTAFDVDGKAIDDFLIDIDEDRNVWYTPISCWQVTLPVK